jgi:hypothetical protein
VTGALLVTLFALAGATAATYLDRRPTPITARLAIGACLSVALLALVAVPLASFAGLTRLIVSAAAVLSALPVLLLWRDREQRVFRADLASAATRVRDAFSGRDRFALAAGLAFVAFTVLLLLAWRQALLLTPDGVVTRSLANRRDLAMHLGMIARFLAGGQLPPEHLEFSGAPLTYPFLVNFGAALLVRMGATYQQALLIQNSVLIVGLIALIYHWARELTGSRLAGLFSPLLVLLGSGLGWLVMLRDLRSTDQGLVDFFMQLPHSYTLNTANLQWGNIATIMMLPGRSLLLGLPLVLIVSMLWWRVLAADRTDTDSARERIDLRTMILAGVVTGLLPLSHTHSFGVVLMAAGGLALLFPYWRLWTFFFAAAALVAVPQLVWITRDSAVQATEFFGWAPGWVHGPEPLWWFWFKNTGLFIPLMVIALAMPDRIVPTRLRRFFLPFIACLILPNLIRLAPRIWDNNKVLIYWYVAAVPLVALVLARMWRYGLLARLASVALVGSLGLAGVLDAWRVVSGVSTVTVFDRAAVDFAAGLQQHTPPDALIVRATTVNHPVLLAGRRSLLGYPSRVWSHGLDTKEREGQIACIYAGCAGASEILARYGIDYLVVGPPERETLTVNDAFVQQFPVEYEAGEYRLYRVNGEMHDATHPGDAATAASASARTR